MPRLAAEDLWADVARIRFEPSDAQRTTLHLGADETTFFGSGRLLGCNLVLTARHVLESTGGAPLPDESWEIRLFRDQVDGRWTGEPLRARVAWRGQGALDLALLQIEENETHRPVERIRLRFGRYNSVMDLDSVWVAGFPRAAREHANVAREYSAPAKLRKADRSGLYRLAIAAANAPKRDEDWTGLSGGTVLLRQRDVVWLLGAVQQVPRAFGEGALEVAPLAAALADKDFRQLIQQCCGDDLLGWEDMEGLPGPYESVGVEAYAASHRTFEATANKPFYGRYHDLAALDATLAEYDRGVILLRAEAGLGKSTFAARWTSLCARDPGTVVLRHAFSVREPLSGARTNMVENLVRQSAFAFGPEELGDGEPGDARRLADRLAALLGRDQPDGMRLVVVLDALDEAAELIEPWTVALGQGVYVLATCRAELGETPAVLRVWRERFQENNALLAEPVLLPLSAAAIAAWLSAAEGRMFTPADPLVLRALAASEGIPLFAAFLIPDAIAALQAGAADPFPVNFADYARQRLEDLERIHAAQTGAWSWDKVLDLFALMTVARAPLPPMWIHGFCGGARLGVLDQRVDRWLWRRAEGVGFAHPRLAVVFAVVLPQFDVDIATVEDRLMAACRNAWNRSREPLQFYALTWLPAHLLDQHKPKEATKLLADGSFHLARIAVSSTEAEAMVRRTAFETISLDRQLASRQPDLAEWRRFWAETEGIVLNGLLQAQRLGLTVSGIFAQLARDRFGVEAAVFQPLAHALPKLPIVTPRLARPCGFRHPSLLRSVDGAHQGSVRGVLALGDGLVSWGGDGAIRLWDREGNPRLGGDPKAHNGGVRGVLALGDGLVSWGEDHAIRLWDREGNPRPGGKPEGNPYRHRVDGVIVREDGFVSWGEEDVIRFWDREGNPRPGGDAGAHSGFVNGSYQWGRINGVLALGDGLVSWSYRGSRAIRLWDREGKALPGDASEAHMGDVDGVLVLEDGFVSWGWQDGAIRFWDREGNPRPGGDPEAHRGWIPGVHYGYSGIKGRIGGVLAVGDGLVSWGGDGAIRFWDREGNPRPGGNPEAHRGWVDGVYQRGGVHGVLALEDGLVSWGEDGAIRLWDCEGNPRPGGDPKAHNGGVGGVLAVGDGLVSWGGDGAIRFWDREGNPQPGGDPEAHSGGVSGVLVLEDGFVSWGRYDGAIRLWNREDILRPGGQPWAHRGGVGGLLASGDRLVSWGRDGAIHFWDREGSPRPGGDPSAHEVGVRGVLALEDSFVSWGRDGAIHFWDREGNPQPERDPEAHSSGVLAVGDGLVSWGGDGAIRLWDCEGNPRPGGDPKAHNGGVGGVLAVGDGLVSWGKSDGGIRFWDWRGRPRPGGDPKAHSGWTPGTHYFNGAYGEVGGVLVLEDGLVSWGGDGYGSIRLWDREGNPRPGGDPKAHNGGVRGVLAVGDGLVSWGEDNAIRLWDREGNPRPGGDLEARKGWGRGVLALGDGLVSWGGDDAIRFWDQEGNLRPGGDPDAHNGGVHEVLALGDGLVSRGADDTIRYWNGRGAPITSWLAPAPLEFVCVIDRELWIGLLGRPFRLLSSG